MPGVSYSWRMAEGTFAVSHLDRPDPTTDVERFFDGFRDGVMSQLKAANATLVKEESLPLGKIPGRQLRIEVQNNIVIVRAYLVDHRNYTVSLAMTKEQVAQEATAVKALDSFKILDAADIDAAMKKKIADATPAALPQSPVAKKPRSDAEDENLKGKVKMVTRESEDLSGTWSVGKRKPSSIDYYNEAGNWTEKRLYDYRGNVMEISVYGYIDGDRAEKSGYIRYEYDPPAMMAPPAAAGQAPPKRDDRYSAKHRYKYDAQNRMTEDAYSYNDGRQGMRYVYNYKDNTVEELVYDSDGKLNGKYLTVLDDKGLRKEETIFDARNGSVRSKYSYAYEYDSHGNWIKEITSEWKTANGVEQSKPSSVTYRTIVYY